MSIRSLRPGAMGAGRSAGKRAIAQTDYTESVTRVFSHRAALESIDWYNFLRRNLTIWNKGIKMHKPFGFVIPPLGF